MIFNHWRLLFYSIGLLVTITSSGVCEPFCEIRTHTWKTRCKWNACEGCSECSIDEDNISTSETCQSWCTMHTSNWKAKCDWGDCEGCSECSIDENASSTSEDILSDGDTSSTSERCKSWCASGTNNWQKKCVWNDCEGCSECSITCKSWCISMHSPLGWERKCDWIQCAGCSECSIDEDSSSTSEICQSWCIINTLNWQRKCDWSHCAGCSECSIDEDTSSTGEDTVSDEDTSSTNEDTSWISEKCQNFCMESTQSWKLKCTWENCSGCPLCIKRPNIVLILDDDVGIGQIPRFFTSAEEFDEISTVYNSNGEQVIFPLPNFKELVARGVRFTDMHSAPKCAPSRYMLLSGNYTPRGNHFRGKWNFNNGKQFKTGQKSIAHVLKEGGNYHTGMFGKWHLGGETPSSGIGEVDRNVENQILTNPAHDWSQPVIGGPQELGFDTSFITAAGTANPPYSYFKDGFLQTAPEDIVRWESGDYDAPMGISKIPNAPGEGDKDWDSTAWNSIMRDEFVEFVDAHIANRALDPFFAYIAPKALHTPWTPPYSFDGELVRGSFEIDILDSMKEVDLVLGAIMRTLETRDLMSSTIIIYGSDNGFSQLNGWWPRNWPVNGPLRGEKADIWEGGHRVPFVIRYDAMLRGNEERSALLGLNDVFSTLCDLARVEIPSDQAMDSNTFSGTLFSSNNPGPNEFFPLWSKFNQIARSIRWKNFKMILEYNNNDLESIPYLFDLDVDIAESNNLCSSSECENAETKEIFDMMLQRLESIEDEMNFRYECTAVSRNFPRCSNSG